MRRYQKEHPEALLHLDIEKLGRIDGVGHRIHVRSATPQARHRLGPRVVDGSRLGYVELLPDERGVTAAKCLERAVAWFASCGIDIRKLLTDNGSCYVASAFTQLCLRLGIRHSRTMPYRPRTNGTPGAYAPRRQM